MCRRLFLGALCATITFALSAEARADPRYFVGVGGSFGWAGNWSTDRDGAGGAGAPGPGDSALFYKAVPYTVTFGSNTTNQSFKLEKGGLVLDLNGQVYELTSSFAAYVGYGIDYSATLTLLDGTVRVDTDGDNVTVGTVQSTGYLNVSSGATLGGGVGQRPSLLIGDDGYGTVTVSSGGTVNSYDVILGQTISDNTRGYYVTDTGVATVTGYSSTWTNASSLTVGYGGNGTLNVTAGANYSSAGTLTIGQLFGSTGNVLVSGTDSMLSLSSSGAVIGASGAGTIQVQSGGNVVHTGGGVIFVGSNSQGVGTITVNGTGSMLTSNGEISVGEAGHGTLNITGGGEVVSDSASLGYNTTASGKATVSGNGSIWTTDTLTVGRSGQGLLTISDGGTLYSGQGTIGVLASGQGEVVVSGTGALWDADTIIVGSSGDGKLTVLDGGEVVSSGAVSVIDPAGAPEARLTIHGGSLTAHDFTRDGSGVLDFTDGTLTVVDGLFSNGGASLTLNGGAAGDRPTLRLRQAASATSANVGNLLIGDDRAATVEVTGGSSLEVPSVSLGAQDGGDGILTISGNNSAFSTNGGDINVGGTAKVGGGSGTVNIETGAWASTGMAGTLRLWAGGQVNVNGGTLYYNALASYGGKVNFNSGRITGLNNISADATTLTTLLGPAHELGIGRTIACNSTMTLSSAIDVNGGSLVGTSLSLGSGGSAEIRGGGSVAFSGVTTAAGSRVFLSDGLLSPGSTLTNGGEISLSGPRATIGTGTLTNNGKLGGTGLVQSKLTNNAAGEVRVAAGERLIFSGTGNVNSGKLEVLGGELEFTQGLTNLIPTGLITARNAQLRFGSGLTNTGALALSFGTSDVFGDINNDGGAINISGGALVTFNDDVTQNGYMVVAKTANTVSEAVFFGTFSGSGGFIGGGNVFSYGDMRPGASPAAVLYDGNLYLSPLTDTFIELAGHAPGEFDRMIVTGELALSGTLDISNLNGFIPLPGDLFSIISYGSRMGVFSDVNNSTSFAGLNFAVLYDAVPGQAVLSVSATPGDATLDGIVDAADYTRWADNYLLTGRNWTTGDFNGDGLVDAADYTIWADHYAPVLTLTSAVPEPSALLLVAIGTAALIAYTLAGHLAVERSNRRAVRRVLHSAGIANYPRQDSNL